MGVNVTAGFEIGDLRFVGARSGMARSGIARAGRSVRTFARSGIARAGKSVRTRPVRAASGRIEKTASRRSATRLDHKRQKPREERMFDPVRAPGPVIGPRLIL